MKLLKKIIIIIACGLLMLLPILQWTKALEAFDINEYNVSLIVNEDGAIDVQETMSVQYNYQRHGLYFNIPTRYNMNFDVDGTKVYKEYKFPINNVKVLSNHNYDIEYSSNGVQIKLGDADYYADTYETYKIKYTVHTKDLDLDGRQFLYYNLIGKWDTTIKDFSFKIQMPKDFNEDDLEFYIGNSLDNINNLDYSIDNNIITGHYNGSIDPNESFTFFLNLDSNYFVYKDHSLQYTIITGLTILLLIFTFIIFLKHGKDDELIVSVEIDAPEGISSAECGYIIDGNVDNRDIMSLIIEWGKKGYLTINDEKNKLTFEKNKDIDENEPDYQKKMFHSLFKGRDLVSTKALRETFYTSIQQCRLDLMSYYHEKDLRIYSYTSIGFRVLATIFTLLPISIYTILVQYNTNYSPIGLAWLVPIILPIILILIILFISESKRASMKTWAIYSIRVLVLVMYAFSTLIFFIATNLQDSSFISFIVISVYTFIMCFISQRMIKRTKRGNRLLGKVLGLRQFILYAELDRLKALAKDNPYFFYDILPYAYSFNLTDVWSDHFADLEIPEVNWYHTYGDYYGYHRINRMLRNLDSAQSAMISTPPVQQSSGGGSFSGGSGGGFSGGGFGGSSGGSW